MLVGHDGGAHGVVGYGIGGGRCSGGTVMMVVVAVEEVVVDVGGDSGRW